MSEKFVSVILPVYNRSVSLSRAIDSVLSQVPAPDELIVVDDGSEEDLSPILSKYAGRIVTHRQANGGAAPARNAGARLAKGRWLAFVDSDDEWVPGHMETLYRDLPGAAPDVVVHLGDMRLKGRGYDQSFFALKAASFPEDRAITVTRPISLVIAGMSCLCAAIRRDVFERVGGFDQTMRIHEDTTLFGRLLREGPFLVTGRTQVIGHRMDDDPIALTGLERREPVLAQATYVRSLESYLDMELTPIERHLVTSRLSGAVLGLARAEARTGAGRPMATLARAARLHPDPLKGWVKSLVAAVLGERGFALMLDRHNGIDRS
jgi:glycosyltransferase involved in cell wall biosynthesis